MNLGEYRAHLVIQYGLVDLVDDTVHFKDAGANKIINSAIRVIEDFDVLERSVYIKPIANGADSLILPPVKKVHSVKIRYINESEIDVAYCSDITMLRSSEFQTDKLWYGFGKLLMSQPDQTSELHPDIGNFSDVVVYTNSADFDDRSQIILFNMGMSSAGNVAVIGEYYSPKLVNDSDSNRWFARTDIVDQAVLFVRDSTLRNREGAATGHQLLDNMLAAVSRRRKNFSSRMRIA